MPRAIERAAKDPAGTPGDPLFTLHPREIWRFLRTQPASFWCINVYLLFEYVRPQHIYEVILGPPWAQITLLMLLASFFLEGNQIRLQTSADLFLGLFSVVVVLSSVTAHSPATSIDKFTEYFTWVAIYLMIANIVTTEKRFLVFMFAFLLYSFKMSQHATRSWASEGFMFRSWGATGAPGWFSNSGEFGIQMAVFFPLVIHFLSLKPRWGRWTPWLFYFMAVSAVVGVIASSSRGAMLAVAVVGLVLVGQSRHKARGLLIAAMMGILAFAMIPEESIARFESIGEDRTSMNRKHYWEFGQELMSKYPVLGVGYANWSDVYQQAHGYRALPHNIFVEAGAELGYLGLAAFVGMILSTFAVNWNTRQMVRPLGEHGRFIAAMAFGLDAALVGFLIGGLFVTVLYYPYFWINLAMTVALRRAALHALQGPSPPPRTARLPASRPPGRRVLQP